MIFLLPQSFRLFVLPTFPLWAYMMKIIERIWSRLLSVPGQDYCTRWRLFWAYPMKVILSVPDEGYFERTWWRLLSVPDEVYFGRTWWRLLSVPDEGYWAYLMKDIHENRHFERTWWRLLSVPDDGYSWKSSFALNFISWFLFLSQYF